MFLRRCVLAVTLYALTGLAQAQAGASALLVGRTEHGATVDLSRHKGQVVLLFFWSTECAVCLDLLPEMRRNLDGWRGKDFVIVAVNQDRTISDLNAYLQVLDAVAPPNPQMEIVWRRDPAHRDNFGDLPARTPTTVVVDREGSVVKRVTGRAAPELWDDIAELVLNCAGCR